MTVESHFAQVNGLNMHYVSCGAGNPVLLLHGFPDTHAIWRHQMPALSAAGLRVIAPDLRGYGKTDAPVATSAYALSFLADDILRLMDALDIAKAALIGHDWGAIVGWQLAMHAPDRFERFAALSVGHPSAIAGAGLPQLLRFWYIAVFKAPLLAEQLLRANDWFLLRQMIKDPQQQEMWRMSLEPEGRLTAALNYYRANFKPGASRRYKRVDIPVMGVWSDRDPALGEAQMRASRDYCAAGFRYERVSGADHWLQLSATEQLNSLLVDFLTRQPSLS